MALMRACRVVRLLSVESRAIERMEALKTVMVILRRKE